MDAPVSYLGRGRSRADQHRPRAATAPLVQNMRSSILWRLRAVPEQANRFQPLKEGLGGTTIDAFRDPSD
jgi:hypothetical protein